MKRDKLWYYNYIILIYLFYNNTICVNCNITFLMNHYYDVTLLLEGDALNKGITCENDNGPVDLNFRPEEKPMNLSQLESKSSGWYIESSNAAYLGPILDDRWLDEGIYNTSENHTIYNCRRRNSKCDHISFSAYTKKTSIKFTVYTLAPGYIIPVDIDSLTKKSFWHHFDIYRTNEAYIITLDGSQIMQVNKPQEGLLDKVIAGDTIKFWNLHNYNLLLANTSNNNEQFGPPRINHNDSICIRMYVALCNECTLNISIVDGTEDKILAYQFVEPNNTMENIINWQTVVIQSNHIPNGSIKLYAFRNSSMTTGFWAINGIGLCKKVDLTILKGKADKKKAKNLICKSLEDNNLNVTFSKNSKNLSSILNTVGYVANESCSNIFNKEKEFCQGHKICIGNLGCTCSWGYSGNKCESVCSNKTWGLNCQRPCGMCHDKASCNHLNGLCDNGCEKGFSGVMCLRDLPVIKILPKLLNTSHTKVTFKVDPAYEGEKKPTTSICQYLKLDTSSKEHWVDGYKKSFTEGVPVTCTLSNLQPATQYKVRVILFTESNMSYNSNDVPELLVNTTCEEIKFYNTVAFSEKALLKWTKTPDTGCSEELYSTVVNAKTFKNMSDYITDLLPFTDYNITISNSFLNTITRINFRTKASKPGPVANIICNPKVYSINISWNEPKKKNGEILNYTVNYKYIKGKLCPDGTKSQQLPRVAKSTKMERSILLQNLDAYSTYNITVGVRNEAGITFAEEVQCNTAASKDISHDELPYHTKINEESVTITLPDCNKIKGELNYIFTYRCWSEWCKDQNETNVGHNVNYSMWRQISHPRNLTPYTEYTFFISALRVNSNKSLKIHGESMKFRTKADSPPQVQNLTVFSRNESVIWLRWKSPYPPYGEIEKYKFGCEDNLSEDYYNCPLYKNYFCGTIFNLKENEVYKLKVQAKNKEVAIWGDLAEIQTVTAQQVSQAPLDVNGHITEDHVLYVRWSHPSITNGPLLHFTITGEPLRHDRNMKNPKKINGILRISEENQNYNFTKENISPSTTYYITVKGVNKYSGKGSSVQVISPPPIPSLKKEPFIKECNESTCEVVVPSANDISQNWKGYILSLKKQDKQELQKTRLRTLDFLNVPLPRTAQSEEDINFAENLVLKIDLNQEGSFIFQNMKKESIVVVIESEYENVTAKRIYNLKSFDGDEEVAKSKYNYFYLLLFLIAPLAIVIYFIYRKKVASNSVLASEKDVNAENISQASSLLRRVSSTGNIRPAPPVPESVEEVPLLDKLSYAIDIKDLENYLKRCLERKDIEDNELTRQHAMLPRGQVHPWNWGVLPINKKKNRYNNLAAYDHTRVVLDRAGETDSDYINANYIDGYESKKSYIATQGPKVTTVNDFWYMIWQEKVEHIIMVANVIEGEKKKCEQYWPELNNVEVFGDFTVETVDVCIWANYVSRTFRISCDGVLRKVQQLHYTVWPDHGIPMYVQTMVPFVKKILTIPLGKSPIVVHCSAGVGRTGTIILCDIMLRMAAKERKVNFYKNLQKMRDHRANLVDNPSQYIFAHLVVYECLFGEDFSVSIDQEFEKRVQNVLRKTTVKPVMEYLDKVLWLDSTLHFSVSVAISDENKLKDRFSDIPPGRTRLYLSRYPYDDDESDYINAVSVNCFQTPGRYIVTQQPLPNTVGDFWRLVFEKEIATILSLNTIDANSQDSCIFWPEGEATINPVQFIEVSLIQENIRNDCKCMQLNMVDLDQNESRIINFIQLNNWPGNRSCPPDEVGLLSILEQWTNMNENKGVPILVACYNGATASGLFVALSFLVEKMKLEHTCDVAMAVRTVRHSRSQFVCEWGQFEFLYKAALAYVRQFSTYSNFN